MAGAYFENIGGVRITVDPLELNSLDGSTRYVNSAGIGTTLNAVTLTRANALGKTLLLDQAGGVVVTLPNATGSGDIYRVLATVIPTTLNSIAVARSADTMVGLVLTVDDSSDNVGGFVISGTDDTITLNLTTTGANAIGEWFTFEDIASNTWLVNGLSYSTGAFATPASAAV